MTRALTTSGAIAENTLRMKLFSTPIAFLAGSRLGQIGVALSTAAGLTLVTLFTTSFFGVRLGPYAGIIGFLVLPAVLTAGLLLIAIGAFKKGSAPRTPEFIRETLWFIALMTVVNLALLLTGTYRGLHDMDSPQFCGQSCHVMNPQFAAYQASVHSRVACVECHIAPGAGGLIDAKMSGSRQLIMFLAGKYSRPIHGDAKENCRACHNPPSGGAEKFVSKTHFGSDEKNTPETTAMMVKTGVIHKAHAAMTCAICHNRAGHNFPTAENAIDAAFLDGRLDRNVPFLRKRALDALTTGTILPEPAVAKVVAEIRTHNIFPAMKIDWGTYPNNIGHQDSPGCFRCHDGSNAKNDCDACHRFVEVKNL
jgi:hypothetical protein